MLNYKYCQQRIHSSQGLRFTNFKTLLSLSLTLLELKALLEEKSVIVELDESQPRDVEVCNCTTLTKLFCTRRVFEVFSLYYYSVNWQPMYCEIVVLIYNPQDQFLATPL
jgi:hypothetical protein